MGTISHSTHRHISQDTWTHQPQRKILMESLETLRQMGQRWSGLLWWQPSQMQRWPHSQMTLTLLWRQTSQSRSPSSRALNSGFSPNRTSRALLTSPNFSSRRRSSARTGRTTSAYPTAPIENNNSIFQNVARQIFYCQNSASFPIAASASPRETTMNSGSRMKRRSEMEQPRVPKRARRCAALMVQVRLLLSDFFWRFSSRKTMHFSLCSSRTSSSMLQLLISAVISLPAATSSKVNRPPDWFSRTASIALGRMNWFLRVRTKLRQVPVLNLQLVTAGQKTSSFVPVCSILWQLTRPSCRAALHCSSSSFFLALYSRRSSLYCWQKQPRQAMAITPIPMNVPSLFSITKLDLQLKPAMKVQVAPEKTVFLGKYRSMGLLGKGAYGKVFLVEAAGEQLALKLIEKAQMSGENEFMVDYLKGEIACMKEMTDPHLVRLLDFQEDAQYFYIVLEYCEGGDLLNLSCTYPDKLFPLPEAAALGSQVILGLQALHARGYLHRDIKPQNVLVKKVAGRRVLKVADFGFAKKATFVAGTIIGTEYFMSPEIYEQGIPGRQTHTYGFEVDVWAFGVLLFYMLNACFPFQIQPVWTCDHKFDELTKQATDFSYRKKVAKTRKKVLENCTDDIEDLFLRIFCPDREKRITFEQIMGHPVFAAHFAHQPEPNQPEPKQTFEAERLIVTLELEEINFPAEVAESVHQVAKNIGEDEALVFSYILTKHHLFLLRNFEKALSAPAYAQEHPGLDWEGYFATSLVGEAKKEARLITKRNTIKMYAYEDKIQERLGALGEQNKHLGAFLEASIEEAALEGAREAAFKSSVNLVYQKLKDFLRTNKILAYYSLLTQVCICHLYKQLRDSRPLKHSIFAAYLAQEKQPLPLLSYSRLIAYLGSCNKEECVALAIKIVESCTPA